MPCIAKFNVLSSIHHFLLYRPVIVFLEMEMFFTFRIFLSGVVSFEL